MMEVQHLIKATAALESISFEEKEAFQQELIALLSDKTTAVWVQKENILHLKCILDFKLAWETPFALALRQSQKEHAKPVLLPFFQEMGPRMPSRAAARQVLLRLIQRNQDPDFLDKLLESKLLENYHLRWLDQLHFLHIDSIRTMIEIENSYRHAWQAGEQRLAFDILQLLYASLLHEQTAAYLARFIQEVVPVFVQRFAHRMNRNQLLANPDRLAEWFLVWERHLRQTETDIPENDEYYQLDFTTIVKYIPEYVWWNNGLRYANGDKNFYFGSEGFRLLALGKSIREVTDGRIYTRRMANEFVNLPYDFDGTQMDMYIYLYCKAHGGGPLLNRVIQDYIRHVAEEDALRRNLELWNPIIQKFSDPAFENLEEIQARELLGYVAHYLRDKPDESLTGFSFERLLNDSHLYYARIAERQAARDERLRQQRLQAALMDQKAWQPHSRIQPMHTADFTFRIIELTTEEALLHEGSVMGHCVGSYTRQCLAGESSIWTLQHHEKADRWRSLVTIQIRNFEIVQMNARFNATPLEEHAKMIRKWAFSQKVRCILEEQW